MQRLGYAVITFLLALPCASQQPAPMRTPHVARVVDADGKPVADAKVTFLAAASHGGLDAADFVQVTTDANGRCRAQLLPTRAYEAWAQRAVGGGAIVSAVVSRAFPSTELRMPARADKAPTNILVTDQYAWRELGAIRVQVLVRGHELAPLAPLASDGLIALPPLPEVALTVRVWCGERLVEFTSMQPGETLQLAPPRTVRVRCVDENDAPLADVELFRLCMGYWGEEGMFSMLALIERQLVGRTGADGTAALLCALPDDPFTSVSGMPLVFIATRPGRIECLAGFTQRPFANGAVADAEKLGGVLPFKLVAREPDRLPVAVRSGAAPQEVALVRGLPIPYDGNSTTSVIDRCHVPLRDGALSMPPLAAGQLLAIEVPNRVPPLAADDPFARLAMPRTMVLPATALAGKLDLDQVLPLRLQVLDAGAGPAMGAAVLCSPLQGGEFVDAAHAMQAEVDASGRLVLPVMPGTWFVMAVHGASWASAVVEAAPGLAAQELRLMPFDRMAVRVVDGDRRPLAGVGFDTSGASWGGGGAAESQMLLSMGYHLASKLLESVHTDADGRATLPFLARKQLRIEFQARHGERTSAEFVLAPNEEPLEIVIR